MKKILLFLGELNNDDLDWIVQKGKKESLPPGKVVIREGRAIDALYIVLSGTLSVEIETLNDRELARIHSGEIVGEISFIDARPPLATVKAVGDSTVLAIPRFQLTSKLQQDKDFAVRFYHAVAWCLAERMRGTVRRLGYGEELHDDAPESNQFTTELHDRWELAEAKFQWLIANAKGH